MYLKGVRPPTKGKHVVIAFVGGLAALLCGNDLLVAVANITSKSSSTQSATWYVHATWSLLSRVHM